MKKIIAIVGITVTNHNYIARSSQKQLIKSIGGKYNFAEYVEQITLYGRCEDIRGYDQSS